jgi:hypothetical protein
MSIENSPEGAVKLSPALQRGVAWFDDESPGGTTYCDEVCRTLN